MNKHMGTILKDRREKAMYTKEKLAGFMGVEEGLISDWEEGKSEPSVTQGILLGNLYGMPVEEIFKGIDVQNMVPEHMQDDFSHDAWINRLANRAAVGANM